MVQLEDIRNIVDSIKTLAQPQLCFGDFLRHERHRKEMSFQQFADFLDISTSSLFNYEKENQTPLAQRFDLICTRLQIPLSERERLRQTLQPKSLTLEQECLLLDSIDVGFTLKQTSSFFSEHGYALSSAAIGYHRSKTMEILGISQKAQIDVQVTDKVDSLELMARKIIKEYRGLEPKAKDKPVKFDYGNVFQELVRLDLNLSSNKGANNVIPEYALTIIRNPETGEVVKTRDIVDLVLPEEGRAVEIKLGKYDPQKIASQVRKQKEAIQALQDTQNKVPIINKVKGLDLIVLEECSETEKLRKILADDSFFTVKTVESIIENPKRGSAVLRKVEEGKFLCFENSYIFDKFYQFFRDKRLKEEELENIRLLLHSINEAFFASTSPDIPYELGSTALQANINLRSNLEGVFEKIFKADEISRDYVEKLLAESFNIPHDFIASVSDYTICHCEDNNGNLMRIQRKFQRKPADLEKALSTIWKKSGRHEPFEYNLENLKALFGYIESRKSKIIDSAAHQDTPDYDLEQLTKAVPELKNQRRRGEEVTLAKELMRYGRGSSSIRWTHMFRPSFKSKMGDVFTLATKIRERITSPEGSIISEFRCANKAAKIYRGLMKLAGSLYLNSTEQGQFLQLQSDIRDLTSRIPAKNEETVQTLARRAAEAGRTSKLPESERQRVNNDYIFYTLKDHLFVLDTLLSSLTRAQAIASFDPHIAGEYLFSTVGRQAPDNTSRYHRILGVSGEDPLYEAISSICINLAQDERLKRLRGRTKSSRELVNHLVNMYRTDQRLVSDFFRYVDNNEQNKVDALLNLDGEDFSHAKDIHYKLRKMQDPELAQLDYSQPVYRQIVRTT